MSTYGQFCPVSKAAEVVCQRWTPLILRELLVGSTRFNEIRRGVPTCSPTLLSKRLKELEVAGVVVCSPTATGPTYTLTEAGLELFPLIQGLGEWGQRWARSDYSPDDLDPGLLLWDVRRFLDPRRLRGPPRRRRAGICINAAEAAVLLGRRRWWRRRSLPDGPGVRGGRDGRRGSARPDRGVDGRHSLRRRPGRRAHHDARPSAS